jgi:hypothetical protein
MSSTFASRVTTLAPILAATPYDDKNENLRKSGWREFWPMALLKGSGLEWLSGKPFASP